MKVLKKITYDVSQRISTNAVETEPLWLVGTSYNKPERVYYGDFIYETLVNSNIGNQPDISPTDWLLVGPDNRSAMFDEQVNTSTASPTPLTVVVKPGERFDSVALLNLQAETYRIEIKDDIGGATIYDTGVVSLISNVIADWYDYFFTEIEYQTDVVLTDLPLYVNATIYLTLTNTGDCGIGVFKYGKTYELGLTQMGGSFGNNDYSAKITDEFGTTTFVRRATSKRMSANVFVDNGRLAFLQKILTDLSSDPSVWIGSSEDGYSPLIVYGFYRSYNCVISYPTFSLCSIDIEGLI
jgi:hypothetical protein